VHKTLLNSVLLSPIVCGGVRPKLPGQTPLGHNPLCFLPFVVRLGSGPRLVGRIGTGVRVSVSFRQKYPPGSVLRCPTAAEKGVMTKGLCAGVDFRLRRITSSASQTILFVVVLCERRRTPPWVLGSTLSDVRRSFIFHTLRLVRPVCSVRYDTIR